MQDILIIYISIRPILIDYHLGNFILSRARKSHLQLATTRFLFFEFWSGEGNRLDEGMFIRFGRLRIKA